MNAYTLIYLFFSLVFTISIFTMQRKQRQTRAALLAEINAKFNRSASRGPRQ